MFRTLSWVVLFWLAALSASAQESEAVTALAKKLRTLEPHKLVGKEAEESAEKYISEQLRKANATSSAEWAKIKTREEWEEFRKQKLTALRESLHLPDRRGKATIHVVGELAGDGYKIQKILYETRPHWFVTANLYLPEKPLTGGMPGILLSHSHHSPKTQGELQDMGATWARVGCAVLVPDHLGHGERRQHPFVTAKDFEREFAVGRQDYYFRYDTSLQLYLAGESLMGWMVHDLMGGVDVLLAQKNIDPKKIALFGAVAGGGDPAAVTAAVDERIALAAPFNFGGPQPETRYPLPDDAETWFNYAGGGGWESTRNLADSASDGFLPWVIVGSIAPRKLIYGHEFSWDRERDPVWKRFEKIWGFYDAKDNLGFAHGRGTLRGMPPEASHCDNIGPIHRSMIHPLLAKWLGVPVTEKDEYKARRDSKELLCWTPELKTKHQPKLLHEKLVEKVKVPLPPRGSSILADPRKRMSILLSLLTDIGVPKHHQLDTAKWDFAQAKLWLVETETKVPVLVLAPLKPRDDKPLVVAIAQSGMRGFLDKRTEELARLLEAGVTVALVDVRHTGTSNDRGQYGDLTSYSASYMMLGRSLMGAQIVDLRMVLALLHQEVHPGKIALWGDSFAEPLAADAQFNYPRRVDRPEESDPLGALLVTLIALHEGKLHAVYANGLLESYTSVFKSPFVQIPHGVCEVWPLGDVPFWVKNIKIKSAFPNRVTGLNQRVDPPHVPPGKSPSAWLIEAL